MEKIFTDLQEKKKTASRQTRSSKLFKTILKAIEEKKGEAIVSLDLRKIDEAVADFFILCEAQSSIQIKAIADNVQQLVEQECDESAYHTEIGDSWSLVDYVNIVVHIFQREQRKFYDLEGLWADAGRQDHEETKTKKS